MIRSVLSRRAEIFNGIDMSPTTGWGAIFDPPTTKLFDDALGALGAEAVAPSPPLILEPLRYGGPSDLHAVLIGQDPYPTPGDAQGLCFSVPRGVAIPASLKNVFGSVVRSGYCRAPPSVGDLRPWAAQGVLMINAALTTRVGERGVHAQIWKPFIIAFITRLSQFRANDPLHFMLWGNHAQSFGTIVGAAVYGHHARTWSHPSPLSDNKQPDDQKFINCDHFTLTNADLTARGLRPITWNNMAPIIAFTDGSCSKNGKPGARAGFAAIIVGCQFGGTVIRGELTPTSYTFVDDVVPAMGIKETSTLVAPSNNRGEYFGIIYALLALLNGKAIGPVEIVSDSKVCVGTLNDWLPTRLRKGTESELKNFDLVMIAWSLLTELRAQATSVTLTWQEAHITSLPASATPRERLLWAGNRKADVEAGNAVPAGEPTYEIEVSNAPALVRRLARGPSVEFG